MLSQLQRVRGAVAKKDLVPILTHFLIKDGRITGGNGWLTISVPCEELNGANFAVPAFAFLRAIDACDKEPTLALQGEKLQIHSGRLHVRLPTSNPAEFPDVDLMQHTDPVPDGFMQAVKSLRPFVGLDAHRMWSHGIMLTDCYAWATNNITLARIPFGMDTDPLVLPSYLLDELLRIGEPPQRMAWDAQHVQFHYADDTWIYSSLLSTDWPDIHQFFEEWEPVRSTVDIAQFAAAVEKILPFAPDLPIVQVDEHGVSTEHGPTHAVVTMNELPACRLRAEPLQAVLEVATALDLSDSPYRFEGMHNLQGVMVGLR